MRKFLVSIFLLFVVNAGVSAQNGQGRNRRSSMGRKECVERLTERMVQQYGLNEKQAAELQALNEKQMMMMPRGNGQRPQRPEGAQAPQGPRPGGNWQEMQKQYNEELQKIMTADQFKAYTEDMEKRRQERQNRQGRPQW